MKINYSLSAKRNTLGYSEIYISVFPYVDGRLRCLRAKTGIRIAAEYFNKHTGINASLLSRRHLDTPELRYHKEQAAALQKLVQHVDDRLTHTDPSLLAASWLREVVDGYYHPEEGTTAPQKPFNEYIDTYLGKKALSAGYINGFYVLARTIARYEMFVRATQPDRCDFSFDVDTVTRDDIDDLRDYMRHEAALCKEYPTLFARIVKSYPPSLGAARRSIAERGTNCVVSRMKKLRAFFLWLNHEGITANRPFDGVSIGAEQYSAPVYITIAERNTIAAAPMPSPQLEIQRDIFIFQCLIGCRVSDLMRLTARNISDGILTYTPHKTKNEGEQAFTARIPLIAEARQLLDKYAGVDPRGRLFPFLSPQQYNYAIKKVFTAAGITRDVEVRNSLTQEMEIHPINEIASSHMARRTFVGNLYFKVQDPTLIGQMSGHVEGSKAFQRYRKIEDDTLRSVVEFLK